MLIHGCLHWWFIHFRSIGRQSERCWDEPGCTEGSPRTLLLTFLLLRCLWLCFIESLQKLRATLVDERHTNRIEHLLTKVVGRQHVLIGTVSAGFGLASYIRFPIHLIIPIFQASPSPMYSIQNNIVYLFYSYVLRYFTIIAQPQSASTSTISMPQQSVVLCFSVRFHANAAVANHFGILCITS